MSKVSLLSLFLAFVMYSCDDDLALGNFPSAQEMAIEMEQDSGMEIDSCNTIGPAFIPSCSGEVVLENFCDTKINADTSVFCGPFFIGDYFLSDMSRDLSAQLCQRADSGELKFRNTTGHTLDFMAQPSRHLYGRTTAETNRQCSDEVSKNQLLCYHRELFSIYYEPLSDELPFLIRIVSQPAPLIEQNPNQQYDRLEILEFPGNQQTTSKLKFVTDALCATVTENLESTKQDSIILNNKVYTDVYYRFPVTPDQSKYYFTLAQGVVGIETKGGELYTLVE